MTATTVAVPSVCGTSPTLVRPRFTAGMLLQHEDLEQLTVYTRELSRLMFRSLFGCGVVCGLKVGTEENCGKVDVTVGAGLALACSGDPIHVPKNARVTIDEHCADVDGPLWIVLCAKTKCCAPRTSVCSPDDEETSSVCTRERDGFEVRVVDEQPKCLCSCLSEPEPAEGEGTETEGADAAAGDTAPIEPAPTAPSRCQCADPRDRCYARHYRGECGCQCERSCSSCNCDCVLLAVLNKEGDGPNPWEVDHSVRRFVRPVLMADPEVQSARAARADSARALWVKEEKTRKKIQAQAEALAGRIMTLEREERELREVQIEEANERARQEIERQLYERTLEIGDLNKRMERLQTDLAKAEKRAAAAKPQKGPKP